MTAGCSAQSRACSLALGEFFSVRDVPHTDVERFGFYVDCADTHSRGILSHYNTPVITLQIFNMAHNHTARIW